MKNLKNTFILALFIASAMFGQNTTTSTTLSAAVAAPVPGTSNNAQICLASATGVVTPSISAPGSYFFIADAGGSGEFDQVKSAGASSTCFNVQRGVLGSTASFGHASGATVYVGPAATSSGDPSRPFGGPFVTRLPIGTCVRASQYTLPLVAAGGIPGVAIGRLIDCINGQWTDVSVIPYLSVNGGTQVSATAPSAATAVSTIVGGIGGATTSTTGTGGAGAAIVATGGLGGAGGTSSGAAGAGGALAYTGGAGGAGPITGGAGGAVTVKAGAGGNGSSAGGSGGDAVLQAGAAGTGGTGTAGKVKVKDAADATKVVSIDASGLTTAVTNTLAFSATTARTTTFPDITGTVPTVVSCGATSTGTANCANTSAVAVPRVYFGTATLGSNAQAITFGTAFTSTATYSCVANDITTRANVVQMVQTSSTVATITNTTGASDVVNWICIGY